MIPMSSEDDGLGGNCRTEVGSLFFVFFIELWVESPDPVTDCFED